MMAHGQSGAVIWVSRLNGETALSTIHSVPKIVILTGAGISAESGLKTFRDGNGLWENHRIEDVATPEAFARDPQIVYTFYNQRRAQLQSPQVFPNAAHKALTRLEQKIGNNCIIVTQNVDNLHERAGSKNVLHMHGQLNAARCCKSNQVFEITEDFDQASQCHCCQPPQRLRPNIVWFGEIPLFMPVITKALMDADIFLSIGTSGNVYPAAGFVQEAADNGATTIEINLHAGANNDLFDQHIQGLATETVPHYVDTLISTLGLE